MEHLRNLRLLDERGKPLGPRIEGVLQRLVPKFRKRFPALHDDLAVTEVLEEAGRKIASRERSSGPIAKLHGYAWVTLRNAATSWLRRPSNRLAQNTLTAENSEAVLSAMAAEYGTPEQIERAILMEEVMSHLSPEERLIFGWKLAGFTSGQIAYLRGTSVNAVDIVFSRIKRKISSLLSVQQYETSSGKLMGQKIEKPATQPPLDDTDSERCDDESSPSFGSIRLQVRR